MVYIVALISIVLGAFGQFSLKLGANQVKVSGGLVRTLLAMAGNPNILAALACFAASMAMWILVLRKLELSIAYPMVSLGYVLVFVLSYFMLHESFSIPKLMGTGLIVLGVIILNIK